jgi:hypothetical protein
LGVFADAVHSQINSHVAFHSATRQENDITLKGSVIRSNEADNVGTEVTVVAQVLGGNTIANIQLGDLAFTGPGAIVHFHSVV